MSSPEEKRKAPRIGFGAKVEIRTADMQTLIMALSGNISLGGIFIKSPKPYPVGTTILLSVFVMPNREQVIDAEGKVAWIRTRPDPKTGEPVGMGVQFTWVSGESQAVLESIVAAGPH